MRDKPFTGSKSVGVFTVNYSKNNPEQLANTARSIAALLRLTVKNQHIEPYEPIGFSIILFLKESHILIEGYPEDDLIEFHIGSCIKLSEETVASLIEEKIGKIKGWSGWLEKEFVGWSCGHL